MELGPTELARLLVFQVAELARRNRALGLPLNAPEAIALASDAMHLAARAGGSFDDVVAAGTASIAAGDLMEGVAPLIDEIRIEVHLREGTRLVVLRGVGRHSAGDDIDEPGAIAVADGDVELNAGLETLVLDVVNESDHPIRVSSHFPFDRVNQRLNFDRKSAVGTRLDIPAGDTIQWLPGETRTVRLVVVQGTQRSNGKAT